MSLTALTRRLAEDPVVAELLGAEDGRAAVPEASRAFLLAGLARLSSAPLVLVVTATAVEAEHLAHDLAAFLPAGRVELLPAWETLPFERVSPGESTMGRRLRTLWRVEQAHRGEHRGELAGDAATVVVVAPIRSLLQRLGTLPADAAPIVVRPGEAVGTEVLVERLVRAGYRREYQVEHRGEVAVRGGIVDVFPSTFDEGIRVDCFGDEVDRLTVFDVTDQRSMRELEVAEIFGCRELALGEPERRRAATLAGEATFAAGQFERIAEGAVFEGIESFLPWLTEERLLTDLLAPEDKVVLVEPRRLRDRAVELVDEEAALAESLATTWGAEGHEFPRLHAGFDRLLARCPARLISLLAAAEGPETPSLAATGWPVALGDTAGTARRLGELARAGASVAVCGESAASAERIAARLEAEGCVLDRLTAPGPAGAGPPGMGPPGTEPTAPGQATPGLTAPGRAGTDEEAGRFDEALAAPGIHVVVVALDRGFVLERDRVAVLAEADLTGRRRPHRVPRARSRPTEGFFDDLAVGGYVVHHVHGVARYGGMVRREIAGAERDYLLLEYRGGDRLYVPSDQIDALTPYSGGEQPSLSRLNGSDWQRTRARVRKEVHEVAQELVVLYQRRLASPGHAFAPDTPWQAELEQAFPYPETPDQLRATDEVKADMEKPVPMDRLVCGDVGFGKTEVAIRAVFKAVQDGKQAAVLVPTTLLAQQHHQTFSERYAPYPVRVEMLSRFLTAAEARAVAAGLADGSVDVVVGTHRLLAEDVRFKDLGLLVVDEEQRFGVSHKEAIKKLSLGVDVLTLTASPIPRTLEMGLTGIRDLSIIDTPPAERQPILTYVGEQDDRAVAEALRRELLREGQVFFVHNRVHDIDKAAEHLGSLVPEARIAVAHGQMDEGSLEQVVLDFAERGYDVLVCTTIIESGIDMPTVNTLVVDRADLLGLGQLHQLRGRVGRAGSRAYAYLFHPRDRVLSEQAYERLRTIGEHTELGSGFKIAMRDLEIRGAGNLLGTDQSGHIAAVGYDLYVRMVAEAVAELKGEEVPQPAEIKLDLPLDAHLPADYVEREDLRLEAYRRLAAVRDEREVEDIENEWLDRYGPLPPAGAALLSIARLRAECVRTGVRELTVVPWRPGAGGPGTLGGPGTATARLSPIRLRASARVRLTRLSPKAVVKEDAEQIIVPCRLGPGLAGELTGLLRGLVPPDLPAVAGA